MRTSQLAYSDLPNAYRPSQREQSDDAIQVSTIRTRYSDLKELFGDPRRVSGVLDEWSFTDARGRVFCVAGDVLVCPTKNHDFEIYAPSHFEGHDFTQWLADRIYAFSLTRGVKFVA